MRLTTHEPNYQPLVINANEPTWRAIYDKLAAYEDAEAEGRLVRAIRCGECKFWERDRISCEGVARCKTGEGGVRFRARNDYCSRGIPKCKDGDKE